MFNIRWYPFNPRVVLKTAWCSLVYVSYEYTLDWHHTMCFDYRFYDNKTFHILLQIFVDSSFTQSHIESSSEAAGLPQS